MVMVIVVIVMVHIRWTSMLTTCSFTPSSTMVHISFKC